MKTPFYDLHSSLGAKMLNFHGWEMPLQYSGIIDEHTNVRNNVGLFDVSHMGRFELKGPGAFDFLQTMITNDLSRLNDHQALYSPMCYENGGIIDDLIVYMVDRQKFVIVVNASNRENDLQWIVSHLEKRDEKEEEKNKKNSKGDDKIKNKNKNKNKNKHDAAITVQDISDQTALLALQGPLAQNVLLEAVSDANSILHLRPFDLLITHILGTQCMISRTGYTGEDGFELFFESSKIEIWSKLMDSGSKFNIKPAGLGARDTLRLEAGLMLYGNDMDENTTPLEVPLKWTVKLENKDFIGKKALLAQQLNRKLVGFEVLEKKRIARHGNEVLMEGHKKGFVTSGSFSPTLNKSIGFCSVPLNVMPDQLIAIDIGNKLYDAKVTASTRFYKRR
jgi:glycine cleavage system T protein (aminomethyltransferase)